MTGANANASNDRAATRRRRGRSWMTSTLEKLNHAPIERGWRDPATQSLTDRAGGQIERFTSGKTQESASAACHQQIMVIGETSDATFTQARQF